MICEYAVGDRCLVAERIAGTQVTTRTDGACRKCLSLNPPAAKNSTTVSLAVAHFYLAGDDEGKRRVMNEYGSVLHRVKRRVFNWRRAVKTWEDAGKPERSAEEVQRIVEICESCDAYNAKTKQCGVCGCLCRKKGMARFNKPRMATEHCPRGKWGALLDVVYPLASGNHGRKVLGSKWDNNELRYSLRSLEKYLPRLGRVFIVTETLPEWLTGVEHIYAKDEHRHNKDANLIDKVLLACKSDVSETFIRLSDDQCLLQEWDGNDVWHQGDTDGLDKGGKWWDRCHRTSDYLKSQGRPTWFYDCHCPAPVERESFIRAMEGVDYQTPPGMCINTLYFNSVDIFRSRMNGQVASVDNEPMVDDLHGPDKLFLNYSDAAAESDSMQQILEKRFPVPSRFEKVNQIRVTSSPMSTRDTTSPEPVVWSLWTGPKPPYVELCQETLVRHNPGARILSMEEFRELQTEDKDVDLSHLKIAQQADWIRLYLLKHFGGIWIDADCIVMRPLDCLLKALDCCTSMTYFEPQGRIGGGFIGAPLGSEHMSDMYDRATDMVKSKDRVSWRALMGDNMNHVLKGHGYQGFLKLDYRLFYPVKPHRKRGLLLGEATDKEFADEFQQNLFTAMLSHNLFPDPLRGMTREKILNSPTLLGHFFRRAMGLLS